MVLGAYRKCAQCVAPAYTNELEPIALTEIQQEKIEVCGRKPGKKNDGS